MVNEYEGWELESLEINLFVNMSSVLKYWFDIM